jgi:hypothetical protein
MKKDGIQTRNRKMSAKSKRHKKTTYAMPPPTGLIGGPCGVDLPPLCSPPSGYDKHHYAAMHGFGPTAGGSSGLGPCRTPAAYLHQGGPGPGFGGPFVSTAFHEAAAAAGYAGLGPPCSAERFASAGVAAAAHFAAGLNGMAGAGGRSVGMIGAVA